jgi:hypothetical protein
MKTRIRFLTVLCAATAFPLIVATPAHAGYIVSLVQQGPNVVATGTGAIDLTGLSLLYHGTYGSQVVPDMAFIATGPTGSPADDVYSGAFSGPSFFGSGSFTFASSGSGDLVGIIGPSPFTLIVPQGYLSGTALSDTAAYYNATFSSLGVTPGTYEWTWGTGANQNFTLEIGAAHTPDNGSTFLLLSGAVVALGYYWRRENVS